MLDYHPINDANMLRRALVAIAAEGFTTQKVLELFQRRNEEPAVLKIAASTLDRFVEGNGGSGKSRELRLIFNILIGIPAYQKYFVRDDGTHVVPLNADPETVIEPPNMAAALAGFFSGNATVGVTNMDHVRRSIGDDYIMIRRNFDTVLALPLGVRVSELTISVSGDEVSLVESQNFSHPGDGTVYNRTDVGYMFVYGPHVHFLTKEVRGGVVQLGYLQQADSDFNADAPAQFFFGHLFATNYRENFPRARFFCRRYNPELHPVKSGIVSLNDVLDARAREFLQADFA